MSVGDSWRQFTAKTSFDVFSLSREQVWNFSVIGGRVYEMRTCPDEEKGCSARDLAKLVSCRAEN